MSLTSGAGRFWGVAKRLPSRTPLRVKLITALLGLVAIALVVISFTGVYILRNYMIGNADDALQSQAETRTVGHAIASYELSGQAATGPGLAVWWVSGGQPQQIVVPTVTGPGPGGGMGGLTSPQLQTESSPDLSGVASWLLAHPGQPITVGAQSGNGRWRVMSEQIQLQNGDGTTTTATAIVATDVSYIFTTIADLVRVDLIVSIVVIIVLAIVGIAVVRSNLRPLDDIEETAEDIAAGHLDRRVPDRDPRTEVGRLGRSINAMLTQIESAFHDRTESEEAAVQSEERMRRFIADASHELRTPLTAIRGFAEYYRQRGGVAAPGAGTRGSLSPEDLNRIMQRVESEAARMGVLVEDLLLLARMDQQRPLERRPVDLLVLAADSVQDARMIAPGRPVRLTVEPGGAFLVLGDEVRLRQVVGNLMSNALTHTPDGTPIDVRLGSGFISGPAPHPGDPAPSIPAAVLEVADRGPGLTPDQARRVFERFYRADQARNRKSGGSGLGLAIVSALVAAHGGTATVDSAPGQGATFRIALPLAPGAGAPDEPDAEPGSVADQETLSSGR
jgi:two-component system, OmpR family, sensor kinase